MRTICLIIGALAMALNATHAHEIETGKGVVCDTQAQVERFASLDANPDALQLINADAKQNVCVISEVQYIRGATLGRARMSKGTAEVVEILVVGFNTPHGWRELAPLIQYTMFVVLEESASLITYKPEHDNVTPEIKEWMKNAALTPAAHKRLGWYGCCDNADRLKTKFVQDNRTDKWYYELNGNWIEIPADTIHTEYDPKMPEQLRAEGVLFIISGTIGCFWPPETGG